MKLALWLFFLPLISLPTKAQMQPGRWQLGAEVNQFTYQKVAPNHTTYMGLVTPSIGYFLGKNLAVSLGLPLGINADKNMPIQFEDSRTRVGLSASLRYYIGQSSLKPFMGFSYNYLLNMNTYRIVGDKFTANDHSTLLIPSVGLAYSLTDKLVLVTSLNYLINANESSTLVIPGTGNNLDVGRPNDKSLSLGLGLQFILGK